VTPPATTPPVAVTPPTVPPKCPKGTTRNTYNPKTGVLVCIRILRDHPKKKKHHVKAATSTQGDHAKKKPKNGAGGVTG
jgi:ketol-acid reductoisomerase